MSADENGSPQTSELAGDDDELDDVDLDGEDELDEDDDDLEDDGLGSVDLNDRFLRSLSYFIEWAKHILTIGSAILVLGATLLKDVVSGLRHPVAQPAAALLLVAAYVFILLAIWQALRFISTASSTVFNESEVIADGDDLLRLRRLIHRTQRYFLAGIVCFSLLAVVSLATWALTE